MTARSTFWLAAATAILVAVAVHSLDFPGSVPRFEKVSGGGILLDAVPSFTADATYARLAQYGEEGRRSYAFRNLTIDLLLPLSVLPFLYLLMRRAIAPLRINPIAVLLLRSLPFAYVVSDLAENAAVLALLHNYPARMVTLARILPYVTVVKRAASLLAVVVPLLIFAARFRRPNRMAPA